MRQRAWPKVRRALCEDARQRGDRLRASVMSRCEYIRRIMYKNDSRWKETKEDPEYARMYGDEKWWTEVKKSVTTLH